MTQEVENTNDLPFTGERFLPEVSGQIAFEHLHRYYFAQRLIDGMRVLDVACGEGYGSHILSSTASSVTGVDISPDVIVHAQRRYGKHNLEFVAASAAELPLEDASFDAVVSFETIEHHDLHEEMLSEIKRVLKPGGLLIISSPNKQHYSIEPGYSNPFHVKELFREEFVELIGRYFKNAELFGQRVAHGSLLIHEDREDGARGFESSLLAGDSYHSYEGISTPLYDLIVASDAPLPAISHSLFEATVHSLMPATFYGVHLAERVSDADRRILELEHLLRTRSMPEDELRQHLAQLSGMLETRHQLLVDQLSSMSRELEKTLTSQLGEASISLENQRLKIASTEAALNAAISALSEEKHKTQVVERERSDVAEKLAATTEKLLDSFSQLTAARQEIEGLHRKAMELDQALASKEAELGSTRAELGQRDAYIQLIHRSLSWRSTAWLRWISKILAGSRV